jgi:hypothetical protein
MTNRLGYTAGSEMTQRTYLSTAMLTAVIGQGVAAGIWSAPSIPRRWPDFG